MATILLSDVVTASVNSEKTRMKKCMMIIIIIITSNRKNHLLVNEKGDVGMANASPKSTETREELSTTCILNKSYGKMPVSV